MSAIQDELIKTIQLLIDKSIGNRTRSDVSTVILEISNGKYKVPIDGVEYWVKDGIGLNLSVGTHVWVHIPNGNPTQMNQAYICAKI